MPIIENENLIDIEYLKVLTALRRDFIVAVAENKFEEARVLNLKMDACSKTLGLELGHSTNNGVYLQTLQPIDGKYQRKTI